MFGKEQFPVVLLTFLPTEAVGKTNPVLWGLCSERKQLHDGATVEVFLNITVKVTPVHLVGLFLGDTHLAVAGHSPLLGGRRVSQVSRTSAGKTKAGKGFSPYRFKDVLREYVF